MQQYAGPGSSIKRKHRDGNAGIARSRKARWDYRKFACLVLGANCLCKPLMQALDGLFQQNRSKQCHCIFRLIIKLLPCCKIFKMSYSSGTLYYN